MANWLRSLVLGVLLSTTGAQAYFEGPFSCSGGNGEDVTTVSGNFVLRRIGGSFAHGEGQLQFEVNRYRLGVSVLRESYSGVAHNWSNSVIDYNNADSAEMGPLSACFDNAVEGQSYENLHSEIVIGNDRITLNCTGQAHSWTGPRCQGDEYQCTRDGIKTCCHSGHH